MIDLHTHTTVSDGTATPKEIIKLANEMGLSAVAITDHDSIEGIKEAKEEAINTDIKLIEGIEFDAIYKNDYRMHILGLNIDSTNEVFLKMYNDYRKGKEDSLDFALCELAKQGISLTRDDIRPYQSRHYLDRQAIAKYLVANNYVSIMKDAWIKYMDKIPFAEGELMPIKDVFKAIHVAGGKAFLAHYHLNIGLNRFNENQKVEVLEELHQLGLDGMEYYYPTFTKDIQSKCQEYITRFNLLKCGGSDFHGLNRPNIQIGIGEGDFQVPDEVLESFL